MRKKYTFFQNIPFLCKFQKQPALAEEAPVVSTTLSIPFSGPAERSLYFTENPDFTAPSAGIHSRRFPGSRIFLYSSDPEHDLAAVPSSLFDHHDLGTLGRHQTGWNHVEPGDEFF